MKKIITVAAIIAVMAGLYACSDHHSEDDHSHDIPTDEAGGHTSPYPSCNAIVMACHKFDVGDGPIHDCHEVGHEATNDEPCAAQKAACLALCVDEAGTGTDAGGTDGESHDGH